MNTECFLENLKEEHLGNLHIADNTRVNIMKHDWTVLSE
jgi:hypothetical protein